MTRSSLRLAAVVALLGAGGALAYVLPGASIARRMADKRDDLHLSGLRVDGTAVFSGGASSQAAEVLGLAMGRPEVQAEMTVWMKVPGRCRIDVGSVDGTRTAVVSSQGRTRVDGAELSPLAAALEPLCALLAVRSGGPEGSAAGAVLRYARSQKVETGTTSLDRLGNQVAYVLGAPGEGQPQLWVYKETFLPARFISKDARGTLWDVRFLDFGSPVAGDWFPRQVEVYRGDELTLRFSATRADGRAAVSDKLF
jgi:hypothetical protein